MEFEFTVAGLTSQQVTIWDAVALKRLCQEDADNFKKLVDSFGKRSAKAQGLSAPITDVHRLRATDQRLYLAATRHGSNTVLLGGLKVGSKKLFVRTVDGSLQEAEPVCVLDFYVHEDYQRKGVGKQLFEFFLSTEQLTPDGVAYDRPSPKLLSFISRHYGFQHYQPQNNNFVLYDSYWKLPSTAAAAHKGRRGPAQQPARAAAAVPPWMAGLPASSRPQVLPSAAALPPSYNNSPANTLPSHHLDTWSPHTSALTHASAPHGSAPQGWGQEASTPSVHSPTAHHSTAPGAGVADSSAGTPRQYGQSPSFGRRGPPPAQEVGTATGGTDFAGYQAGYQAGLPAHRGDALDVFLDRGTGTGVGGTLDTQQQTLDGGPGGPSAMRASQQQPLSASAGRTESGQPGWRWPAPVGSVHTTQGPAHLYQAMPAPAAGSGMPGTPAQPPSHQTGPGATYPSAYQASPYQSTHQVGYSSGQQLGPPSEHQTAYAGMGQGAHGGSYITSSYNQPHPGGGYNHPGGGRTYGEQSGGAGHMMMQALQQSRQLHGVRANGSTSTGTPGLRYTVPPWGQDGDMASGAPLTGRGAGQQLGTPPSAGLQQQPQPSCAYGAGHMHEQQQLQAPYGTMADHQAYYQQQQQGTPLGGAGQLGPTYGRSPAPAQLQGSPFSSSKGGKPGGVVNAREAGLAARAGSGAAGCLVW